MPNRNHRKKTVRQADKARVRNKVKRSSMRTQMKRVLEAIESGDKTNAQQELALAMKRIDKAARTRVIHPNNASRKKSGLTRKVNAMA
jgi:small subunit ribosomal protein S20